MLAHQSPSLRQRRKFPEALACCPKPGMCGLTLKVWAGGVGRAWCSRPARGACRVAAIIGSWLPWGVICGGSKSVELVCGAFGLTAEPGASLVPVSRGAMGRIWRLDLGAERYAVKELFWESDEEPVRQEAAFTANLQSAGIWPPGSLPAWNGRFLQELPPCNGGGWL